MTDQTWQCHFKSLPKQITVGQKLILLCDGEKALRLSPPVHIQFPSDSQLYSLHVLKTVKAEDHFLALEVVSYRTGDFKGSFTVTDGEKGFVVNDLSFSVQSVLEKKSPAQPHGPFGPFAPDPPLWLLVVTVFSFLCVVLCGLVILRRLLKRRRFINKLIKRKTYVNPSKAFIKSLRRQKEDSPQFIDKLSELFRIFLEDIFFIPALNKTSRQIMKALEKRHKEIYAQEGKNIMQILKEISYLKTSARDRTAILKLKKHCQQIVFLLDNQGGKQ